MHKLRNTTTASTVIMQINKLSDRFSEDVEAVNQMCF